jgi:nitrate reductase gamma subunit
MSDPMEFLLWTKGPMFTWAIAIFAIGMAARLVEIFVLGRAPNYAEPRAGEWGPGFRTVITRSVADAGTFARAPFNVIAGWLWHVGFLIALLLFVPHIELINSVLGLRWPGLPNPLVDAATAITIVALVAVLIHRLNHPVMKHISTLDDYIAWTVTFLPLLTGYIAYHRLINPYPVALGMHILTAEIFLIVLPFTKLTHIFTSFVARWYNGASFGRRGIES